MTLYTPIHPIQTNQDWFTADVNYFKNNGTEIYQSQELIDNRNREEPLRTVADSTSTIAIKHFLILLVLPLYSLIVIAIHLIRMVTLVTVNACKGNFPESFFSVVQEVCAVVRAPMFTIALWFCSLFGLAFPLQMRTVFAELERVWSFSDRYHSIQRLPKTEEAIKEYFTERNSKKTFFLAFCFQSIGKLNDQTRVHSYREILPT